MINRIEKMETKEKTIEDLERLIELKQEVIFAGHSEMYLSGLRADIFRLCVRWGFPALKPNSSTNLNLRTND